MDEQPGAHYGRDPEVGPRHPANGIEPRVVIAVVRDQLDRVAQPVRQVADQANPAEAAREDGQGGGYQGGALGVPSAEERAGQGVDDQRQCARQDRGGGDERGNGKEPGCAGRDGGVEVLEPVVDERNAREIRDLRRKVAGVQALGDREVDT